MAARKKKSRRRAAARAAKPKATARKRGARTRRKTAPKRVSKRAGAKRGAAKRSAAAKRTARAKRTSAPAATKAPLGQTAAPETIAPPSPASEARGYAASLAVLASEPIRTGVVRHFFPHVRAALVVLEAPLAAGDRIHVRGATSDFLASIAALRVDGKNSARAEAGEVTLALPERARPGDVVYALRAPA